MSRPNTITDFFVMFDEAGKDDCWPWKGSLSRENGYGKFGLDGKRHRAHVMSLVLAVGLDADPSKNQACHTCDNPPCVNPSHLYWGTRSDNMRDMVNRGRGKVPGIKGESHYKSGLSEDDVRKMRNLFKAGGCTQFELADMFGITQSAVSLIVNNKNWKHVV